MRRTVHPGSVEKVVRVSSSREARARGVEQSSGPAQRQTGTVIGKAEPDHASPPPQSRLCPLQIPQSSNFPTTSNVVGKVRTSIPAHFQSKGRKLAAECETRSDIWPQSYHWRVEITRLWTGAAGVRAQGARTTGELSGEGSGMSGRRELPGRTDPEVDSRVRHETDQRGRGKMAIPRRVMVGGTALSRGCGPAVGALQRAERPANVRDATEPGVTGAGWSLRWWCEMGRGGGGWFDGLIHIRHCRVVRKREAEESRLATPVGRKPTRNLGRAQGGMADGQPTSADTLSFVPAGFSSPCSILCGQLFWALAEARRTRCRCSRWPTTNSAASWTFSTPSSSHHLSLSITLTLSRLQFNAWMTVFQFPLSGIPGADNATRCKLYWPKS
ncbi:uncharacterized protein J3D65DRAFT_151189 [Phyllosticta citribraziliensis]|uniref:Uncharacterized protein n=1 Tax=Phyllosticta citribraziliensis TaxID=989973 RepID=A0ABR1L4V3_9PEZI